MTRAIRQRGTADFVPAELESIIAEFRSITERGYGQFCGLARALETIGERWGPLIIRDLLIFPRTRADLQRGLPRIPADMLISRLREFEREGIVDTRTLPDGAVEYRLTEYGSELDEILLALGRWGARRMGNPRSGEIITVASVLSAMGATFDRAAAAGVHVSYQIEVADLLFQVRIDDGVLAVSDQPLPDADLLLKTEVAAMKQLLSGDLSPEDAVASGQVSISGDPALLATYIQLFHL